MATGVEDRCDPLPLKRPKRVRHCAHNATRIDGWTLGAANQKKLPQFWYL
jgi:hypothetical protein